MLSLFSQGYELYLEDITACSTITLSDYLTSLCSSLLPLALVFYIGGSLFRFLVYFGLYVEVMYVGW